MRRQAGQEWSEPCELLLRVCDEIVKGTSSLPDLEMLGFKWQKRPSQRGKEADMDSSLFAEYTLCYISMEEEGRRVRMGKMPKTNADSSLTEAHG